MKTTLKTIKRFFFVLLIPVTLLLGCQEDLTQSDASAMPPKDKIIIKDKAQASAMPPKDKIIIKDNA